MFRRLIGAIAAAGALALGGAIAAPATAAHAAATPQPTKGEAGYNFAGGNAHFRYVAATVYLRNPSQYSASIGGLGQSVQLWGGGRVYVLGVSATTDGTDTTWTPMVKVYNNTTHALVDQGGFAASYPSGHAVKESIYYNRVTGDLSFTVQDVITMTSNVFKTNVGTGVNFMQARVGTEFGATPWSAPATFTAPSNREKTARFFNAALTNYLGHRYALIGYWTNTPLVMTGSGSVVEADAGPIYYDNAFNTFLLP